MKSILLNIAKEEFNNNSNKVHFVDDKYANNFLNNLDKYPHAFVLACLMDKRIKAERAWMIPYKVYKELGSFDIDYLYKKPLSRYKRIFNAGNYHIHNNEAAKYFYKAIHLIKDKYDGDASKIWKDNPSSATVVYRFIEFEGIGIKIATMAANILARQFKIPMSDYCSIDVSPDVHVRRVMKRLYNLPDNATTEQIIYKAREINPTFPGLIDYTCWRIGRELCHPKKIECDKCPINKECCYYKNKK